MVLQDISRRFLSLLLLLLLVSVLFLTCIPAPQAHADSGEVNIVWRAANGAILGTETVGIVNVSGCQALSAGTQTTIQAGSIGQQVTASNSFNVP